MRRFRVVMAPKDSLSNSLNERFADLYGDAGGIEVAIAPGRVNLIGEHTDYNDGWVLPMAIDRHVGVAFRRREDRLLRAYSVLFGESVEVDMSSLESIADRGWVSYVAGMARLLEESGINVRGIDCVIDGGLPLGAGLSSSAALEMAAARSLCAAADAAWVPREMALLGQQVEHRFLGVRCGLMDQLASATAEKGCAVLLDCRSTETEPVPIPEQARLVVMYTGLSRSLAGGAYNERRASCEEAVEILRRLDPEVRALRDVDMELLEAARPQMGPTTFMRARHVVEENRRPRAMAIALAGGELATAGRLMNDSHASLRDLYAVSSPELDRMTELARAHPACFGARLTGAGFGGCAVALVAAAGADSFVAELEAAYRAAVDLPCELFASPPAAGARLLSAVRR